MAIHWAYKDPHLDSQLEQGDVLKCTSALIALLRDYHPYYADNPLNRFYMVLTQSCDLYTRGAAGRKTKYISIAPVRPLPAVIEHEFGEKLTRVDQVLYGSTRLEAEVQRFLERLFNNNEPSYFYLESEPTRGFSESMCAMLPLAISFKAEHYQTLLDAKIIGLEDSFQAKLGWLIGQLYSRVGTRDFSAAIVSDRAQKEANALGLWIDGTKYDAFEEALRGLKAESPDKQITLKVVEDLVRGLPARKSQVIEAILDIALRSGVAENPSNARFKLRRGLENDTKFATYFRE